MPRVLEPPVLIITLTVQPLTDKSVWTARGRGGGALLGGLGLALDRHAEQHRAAASATLHPDPFSWAWHLGHLWGPALHCLRSLRFSDGDDYSPREGWAQDPH